MAEWGSQDPPGIVSDKTPAMNVVIVGGTRFLGRPLCELYAEAVLPTRRLPPGEAAHESRARAAPASRASDGSQTARPAIGSSRLARAGAVVNPADESSVDRRWLGRRS